MVSSPSTSRAGSDRSQRRVQLRGRRDSAATTRPSTTSEPRRTSQGTVTERDTTPIAIACCVLGAALAVNRCSPGRVATMSRRGRIAIGPASAYGVTRGDEAAREAREKRVLSRLRSPRR